MDYIVLWEKAILGQILLGKLPPEKLPLGQLPAVQFSPERFPLFLMICIGYPNLA